MKLDHLTWLEVEAYLKRSRGIILPVGSTEQHGPMGLIGTDSLCAEAIAERAAERADALVAPVLGYTPAPFNMGFPGTVSVSEATFRALFLEILEGLASHSFTRLFVLNAHGANLAPMRQAVESFCGADVMIRSWWDFEEVNALRRKFYGEWEGMHATPAEISITQALYRSLPAGDAAAPPRKLAPAEIEARTGDNHGPADEHKAEFPDGRVGSHSALADPDHGHELLKTAAEAVEREYLKFANS